MDDSHLRRLLSSARGERPRSLPEGFTDEVVRRTRQVETLELFWPVLTAASVLALTVAGTTGLWLAQGRSSPQAPPPLSLFQPQPDTNPFQMP